MVYVRARARARVRAIRVCARAGTQVLLPRPAAAARGDVVIVRTEARFGPPAPSFLFRATLLQRTETSGCRRPGLAARQAAEGSGWSYGERRVRLGEVELLFEDLYPDFDN